jgi:hypothetical protein
MTTPYTKTDYPASPTPTSETSAGGWTQAELRDGASKPPEGAGQPNAVGHRHDGVDANESGIVLPGGQPLPSSSMSPPSPTPKP